MKTVHITTDTSAVIIAEHHQFSNQLPAFTHNIYTHHSVTHYLADQMGLK